MVAMLVTRTNRPKFAETKIVFHFQNLLRCLKEMPLPFDSFRRATKVKRCSHSDVE